MCCITHEERDRRDALNGETVVLAENEDFRCRCTFGTPCRRRITQEDQRCDWCRGPGHQEDCMKQQEQATRQRQAITDQLWGPPRRAAVSEYEKAAEEFRRAAQGWPEIRISLKSAVQASPGTEWFRSSGYGRTGRARPGDGSDRLAGRSEARQSGRRLDRWAGLGLAVLA